VSLLPDMLTAIRSNDQDRLRALVSRYRSLIDSSNDIKAELLIGATSNNNKAVVDYLLDEIGISPNVQSAHTGNTALMIATENGNLEIVKKLMEKGARTDIRNNEEHTVSDFILEEDDPEEPVLTEIRNIIITATKGQKTQAGGRRRRTKKTHRRPRRSASKTARRRRLARRTK